MSGLQSLNIYSPDDLRSLPGGERVFISHRRADKPLAEAVAAVLDGQGVHYWFDRDDEDTRRAAALGMAGDQSLVHSIERGIRHCSQMLGLLSTRTRGSWWVPYEIGFSRSAGTRTSYLVLDSIRSMDALPGYVRLAANYWSVDELVRWAASLAGGHLRAEARPLDLAAIAALEEFVPRRPPEPKAGHLSARALLAIGQLFDARTQEAIRLTSTEEFRWLPTAGGLVRDLAYDLYAPLAFYQLEAGLLGAAEREVLGWLYRSVTSDYGLAQLAPALDYDPKKRDWQRLRYDDPASTWLQGLTRPQVRERLDRFLIVPDMDQRPRLATREEFKAEFDRILRSGGEREQRKLGVLVNPLFGFTPQDRPVFLRVLAMQQLLYTKLAVQPAAVSFERPLVDQIQQFIGR